jgi:hypothetical protein
MSRRVVRAVIAAPSVAGPRRPGRPLGTARLSSAQPIGPPRPVTYPTSALSCKVHLALGADLAARPETWSWVDITRFVRHDDGIEVTSGRKDERDVVPPGEGKLRLDNSDGRFSRRNPTGPYYGLLTKNTPIRAVVDPGSGEVARMEMFISEWPARSDLTLTDVTTPIVCAGILRRLGQGAVFKSALRRAYLGLTSAPTLYWPLEEGPDSSTGAAAIGGLATYPIQSPAVFGGEPIGASGAAAGVDFSGGGSLLLPTGQAPAAAPNGWEFECVVAFDALPSISVGQTLAIASASSGSGAAATMGFGIKNSGGTIYWSDFIFDAAGSGSTVSLTTLGAVEAGRTYHVRMVGHQEGAGLRLTVYIDGTSEFDDGFNDTVLMPTRILVNTSYDPTNAALVANTPFFSSAAFWNARRSTVPATYLAGDGYSGEQAHERIARLCTEEGVPYTATASTSPTMGAQQLKSFLQLLRQCEAVDAGVLYEQGFGLGYQSRTERHNAPVALQLDFAAGHISAEPEHADDDQQIRNSWTISRLNGGEATVEDQTSIAANGLYDDSAELALERDAQCKHAAGWRLHVGTVEEDRWPRFDIDFASTGGRTLISSWLALAFGARSTVANPPDMYSPDPVDVFVEGRWERWDPINWNAAIFTTPATPYEVYVVAASGNRGRVDMAHSSVAVEAASGATALSVASTGALWVTGPVSFDIAVGGERMTVTNISGSSSPQTFTVTRSANGVSKIQAVGTKVRLWKPGVYAQ